MNTTGQADWLQTIERSGDLRELLKAEPEQKTKLLKLEWANESVRAEFVDDFAAFSAFVQSLVDEVATTHRTAKRPLVHTAP